MAVVYWKRNRTLAVTQFEGYAHRENTVPVYKPENKILSSSNVKRNIFYAIVISSYLIARIAY